MALGALGAYGVFFWFFMPGPGPPNLFSVFVFSLLPASSEAPGLALTERSKTLRPAFEPADAAAAFMSGGEWARRVRPNAAVVCFCRRAAKLNRGAKETSAPRAPSSLVGFRRSPHTLVMCR